MGPQWGCGAGKYIEAHLRVGMTSFPLIQRLERDFHNILGYPQHIVVLLPNLSEYCS